MRKPILAGLVVLAMTGSAFAHGTEKHEATSGQPPEMVETAFGKTGDPKAVTRTISLSMSDEMRFTPNAVSVKVGETVRFIVKNQGEVLHEMVIGSAEDLKKHAKMMEEFPEMEHDEPFMAHVEPGTDGEIVWTFSKAGSFEFGCLIPGHFDAGMKGTIVVND